MMILQAVSTYFYIKKLIACFSQFNAAVMFLNGTCTFNVGWITAFVRLSWHTGIDDLCKSCSITENISPLFQVCLRND